MIKIAPSILSADFSDMKNEILSISNAEYIHIDVMDGVFVPNITFGPKMVKDNRKYTEQVFDVHLMIVNPIKYFESFAKAGADIITFHVEAEENVIEALDMLKKLGVKGGVVISPDTNVSKIENALPYCDMVLVMSVYPGFGGQSFIDSSLDKIKRLKELKDKNGYSYDIEIDGGINEKTVILAKDAGANVIVAGSNVFNAKDRNKQIDLLRKL